MRTRQEIIERINAYTSIRKDLLRQNKFEKANYYFNLISLLEWVLYGE
jgi:hypothetical protein